MFKYAFTSALLAALLAWSPIGAAYGQTTTAKEEIKKEKKTTTSTAKKKPTAGQAAARERQKQCGVEWKQAKTAGKIAKGQTWPKYWSECNKRLKAKSG